MGIIKWNQIPLIYIKSMSGCHLIKYWMKPTHLIAIRNWKPYSEISCEHSNSSSSHGPIFLIENVGLEFHWNSSSSSSGARWPWHRIATMCIYGFVKLRWKTYIRITSKHIIGFNRICCLKSLRISHPTKWQIVLFGSFQVCIAAAARIAHGTNQRDRRLHIASIVAVTQRLPLITLVARCYEPGCGWDRDGRGALAGGMSCLQLYLLSMYF